MFVLLFMYTGVGISKTSSYDADRLLEVAQFSVNYFFDSKSKSHFERKKSQPSKSAGRCYGRSARLLLTLNIPPCPKKKEKAASRSIHRSWSKHASRGSRSQLPCKPSLGNPGQPRIQRAQIQRSEQIIVRNIMNGS